MAPLRASLARSPPRLGRSQAGGLHPQTSRAAPPGAPSRTGPLLPRSPSRRGSGHGCARWPGWSTACGCPRWTPSPSPSPLDSVFQKQGNRSVVNAQRCPPEGVSPCSGGGGQTSGPPARAAVHLGWAARLSTARAGHRAERQRHPVPVPARRRRSALCRFIRENDSCEFGKNLALARSSARFLVFFSYSNLTLRSVKFDTAQSNFQ